MVNGKGVTIGTAHLLVQSFSRRGPHQEAVQWSGSSHHDHHFHRYHQEECVLPCRSIAWLLLGCCCGERIRIGRVGSFFCWCGRACGCTVCCSQALLLSVGYPSFLKFVWISLYVCSECSAGSSLFREIFCASMTSCACEVFRQVRSTTLSYQVPSPRPCVVVFFLCSAFDSMDNPTLSWVLTPFCFCLFFRHACLSSQKQHLALVSPSSCFVLPS